MAGRSSAVAAYCRPHPIAGDRALSRQGCQYQTRRDSGHFDSAELSHNRVFGIFALIRVRPFNSARMVTIIAALSITIVRIPVFFGGKSILESATLPIFILCVGWGLPRQRRGSLANWPAAIAFLYAALIAIALFRGADARVYGTTTSALIQSATYLLFVAFGIILITTARNTRERNERLVAIALAPAAYVVINAVMNLAGLQNSEPNGSTAGTPAEILRLFGISAGRERFPLATSINLFSIIVAAALVSIVILRFRTSSLTSRTIVGTTISACIYCLLLGDSRAALLIAGIVILIFALKFRIPAIGVGGIVPLLPLAIIGLIALVDSTNVGSALSRGSGQGQEVATATGRLYIWKGSWEVLKHFNIQELYGWGAAGHVTSGAYLRYLPYFGYNSSDTSLFTHDIVLQTLFDMGIIGLVVLVVAVWSTWRALQSYIYTDSQSPAIALMAILLVIILSGGTEVSPTYYSQEALLQVLLIMGAAAGLTSSTRLTGKRSVTRTHPPPTMPVVAA
jgi:O-antigen ligase